jgi:hypothetical protein
VIPWASIFQIGIDNVPDVFLFIRAEASLEGYMAHKQFAFELHRSGHPAGVSCDELGPALGPIRFLEKTITGFAPRPINELNAMLGWTIGRRVDCHDILPGLQTIARALNGGELARAMIATQFLHLETLSNSQARRAANVVALLKAAPDDPKHPGWPAGTSDDRGGKFRPKDGASSEIQNGQDVQLPDARRMIVRSVEKKIAKRMIKSFLRSLLTWRRVLRFLGEGASNAIPGVDAIGDAAMAVDVAEVAANSWR